MRLLASLTVAVALLTAPAVARAADSEEDIDAFARVVVGETALRSGPGVGHRVIYRAHRGETFLIEGREGTGFWLKVVLPDGREGWVLGDTVEPVGAGEDAPEGASKPGFFAPPALQEAHGGFALMAGLFDGSGYVELRPAFVLAPAIAIEPYAGLALLDDGKRFIYGLGGTLNLAPDWAIAPFLHIGAGGLREIPNDEFVRPTLDFFHARAGGGLLVSLRWRILLRIEANNTVIFTEDSYDNVQTYYGGLGTYF
ncbi:MAG: SH3 domain-containing protein [Myxococcales bacterium]|nr:SH3 domain-containing protein [Myxococcales bacterium]MCB9580613.1 SH3 domain-containing protein [Polyangiaceae bacterium]